LPPASDCRAGQLWQFAGFPVADMRAQMEQTFQNLDRCLKAAGATWADVVKTNTFVTDFDEFQKCGDIRMRYLGVAARPARQSASRVSPDPIS
jgi:enamine deaminase RidA (YjgF/YER057c/UK114 family)